MFGTEDQWMANVEGAMIEAPWTVCSIQLGAVWKWFSPGSRTEPGIWALQKFGFVS